MVNLLAAKLSTPTRLSIAALGEMFSTSLAEGISLEILTAPNAGPIACAWNATWLEVQHWKVETRMISNDWCRSDIKRIQHVYQGLNTQQYTSYLKKATTPEDHASCSPQKCVSAQIKGPTYRLSYATESCSCTQLAIDIEAVRRILRDTKSFPILRITKCDDLQTLSVAVEYETDKLYIALSHVSGLQFS